MSILKWSRVNFTQCFANSLRAHNSPASHFWRGAALQHLQFQMTAVTRSGYSVPGGGDPEGGHSDSWNRLPHPHTHSRMGRYSYQCCVKWDFSLIKLNEKLSFLAIRKQRKQMDFKSGAAEKWLAGRLCTPFTHVHSTWSPPRELGSGSHWQRYI